MTALPQKTYISPEEYLVMEAVSPVKHEYFNGEIFQMAGASYEHNRITTNIIGELFSRLKGTRCQVIESDMRLFVEATGLYTYPDVMVICGKPEIRRREGLDNLLNPTVIVEVLSASTAEYDRGPKFDQYKTISSLKEYVLVWQDKKRIARFTKRDDASWILTDFIGDDAEIDFVSIDCGLLLEDIYDNVEVDVDG